MKRMKLPGARWPGRRAATSILAVGACWTASGCSGASSTDQGALFDDPMAMGTGGVPSGPPPGASGSSGAAPIGATGGSSSEPASEAGAGGGGSLPPEQPPPPSYDPSVTFDWPETAATGEPCLPGTYVGQFTCEVTFIGLFPSIITGPVSFTLEPSMDGEFLEVRDGKLEGIAAQYNVTFTSPLTGQLECDSNAFSADAPSGAYTDGLFIVGQFTGALDAQLDRPTQTLSGSWTLTTYPDAAISCTGPWSAARQP